MRNYLFPLPILFSFCLLARTFGADSVQVLFDFAANLDTAKVSAQDAKVSASDKALRVTTGQQQSWPGVTLPSPNGSWDLTPFERVSVSIRNVGTNSVNISCRVDNAGADGSRNCLTGSRVFKPGEAATLSVSLKRTSAGKLDGKLFGMRGYPVMAGGEGTIAPAKVTQLLVFVTKPSAEHVFEIASVRAEGRYVPPTAWVSDADPFFPCIDTFGQYLHKDWHGKVHSLTELEARAKLEARELAANPGPKDWDQYGGWKSGPQLKSTGFFRTEKYQGKWWLVDPEGRLFFSHGIDCVRMRDVTPIDERETWFQDFPGAKAEFAQFLGSGYALKGHYAGRNAKTFAFAEANLFRKYGQDYKRLAGENAHRRLRSWGLNTIANWSDPLIFGMRKTPYTDAIGSRGAKMLEGSEGYWGKFPDVFDASFKAGLERSMASKVGKSAGDPWCLGYYCDNEMSWGDDGALAVAALRSSPDQPAKQAFVEDLKKKYGDIAKLNQIWLTKYDFWDALLSGRSGPWQQKGGTMNGETWEDCRAFCTRTAEVYFRTVREVIKEKAPQQLYLGCRFAWVNARAAAASAKFCDVVSYNLYRRSVADFKFNGGADVPLIIGEFHFGALDRGMFHTGLVPVKDQAERAEVYKEYVRGALRHPAFVGTHWFQYQDEPVTGRVYDEENYQIGFVDVADTPYAETISACREVGSGMYQYRLSHSP